MRSNKGTQKLPNDPLASGRNKSKYVKLSRRAHTLPARIPTKYLAYFAAATTLFAGCYIANKIYNFNQEAFNKKVGKIIENGAVAVFDSKPVEQAWQGWLERAFANVQTHNALLHLLVNGI